MPVKYLTLWAFICSLDASAKPYLLLNLLPEGLGLEKDHLPPYHECDSIELLSLLRARLAGDFDDGMIAGVFADAAEEAGVDGFEFPRVQGKIKSPASLSAEEMRNYFRRQRELGRELLPGFRASASGLRRAVASMMIENGFVSGLRFQPSAGPSLVREALERYRKTLRKIRGSSTVVPLLREDPVWPVLTHLLLELEDLATPDLSGLKALQSLELRQNDPFPHPFDWGDLSNLPPLRSLRLRDGIHANFQGILQWEGLKNLKTFHWDKIPIESHEEMRRVAERIVEGENFGEYQDFGAYSLLARAYLNSPKSSKLERLTVYNAWHLEDGDVRAFRERRGMTELALLSWLDPLSELASWQSWNSLIRLRISSDVGFAENPEAFFDGMRLRGNAYPLREVSISHSNTNSSAHELATLFVQEEALFPDLVSLDISNVHEDLVRGRVDRRMGTVAGSLVTLAGSSGLKRLNSLTLNLASMRREDYEALANSPYLQVSDLRLIGAGNSAEVHEGLALLAGSRQLQEHLLTLTLATFSSNLMSWQWRPLGTHRRSLDSILRPLLEKGVQVRIQPTFHRYED